MAPRQAERDAAPGTRVGPALAQATLGVGATARQERLQRPTFRRLLVAVDGSSASRPALDWAAALAKMYDAHVTVVSVGPSEDVAAALRASAWAWKAVGPSFQESQDEAGKVLRRAEDYLRGLGVKPQGELMRGTPGSSIVGLAISDENDLVVLGSHGHGLGERLNLGSVGSAVKHHVPCSVLIARGPPKVRRVLLATDGSPPARLAVECGLDLAAKLGAQAVLAHVIDAAAYGLAREFQREEWKALAAKARTDAAEHGVPVRVAVGLAAPGLRRFAKEEEAGLIVLGSRGLGGLRSLALGSVSDRLSHKAAQSILVVKPLAREGS